LSLEDRPDFFKAGSVNQRHGEGPIRGLTGVSTAFFGTLPLFVITHQRFSPTRVSFVW